MVWIVVLGFEKKRKAKAPAAKRVTHATRIREMKTMVVGVDLCEESEEEVESMLKKRKVVVGLGGSSSWVGTGLLSPQNSLFAFSILIFLNPTKFYFLKKTKRKKRKNRRIKNQKFVPKKKKKQKKAFIYSLEPKN